MVGNLRAYLITLASFMDYGGSDERSYVTYPSSFPFLCCRTKERIVGFLAGFSVRFFVVNVYVGAGYEKKKREDEYCYANPFPKSYLVRVILAVFFDLFLSAYILKV